MFCPAVAHANRAQASNDAPIALEDGRWLSHFALPHEEKKIFAFRATTSPNDARGAGADLHELLQCSSLETSPALARSGSLHLSARAGSCDSSMAPAAAPPPDLVRELVALSRAMQEKDAQGSCRLAWARKQAGAMSRLQRCFRFS